ncbi:peptidase M17, leucyl aminopeptidase [Dimargaris cristalligena]|uniref:Peptidase M17, leucyl aminopeptidase n=1 Tax=Dimargaris cristalligena TaxID=215637 RepID=A0A4V1J4I1_9FUNG|nr:peptidase M17, leucyl aminopeptidase [Dimargaris cristalligena]|eukprot:RKP35639.1 peptidase M17, leucyl aminopeptidase [Dimargaris cristalligena]
MISGEAQNLARRWADTPANLMTPTKFCEEVVQHLGSLNHITIHVRDQAWAEAQKMGLFLGVSRGSEEPLRFLEIEYRGNTQKSGVDIGLVGKGVTFDSGGIDIKPWQGMEDMKGDMGGAACVVATMYGLARQGVPVNATCVVPLCENMPDGRAVKPGDVLTARNGKTVEVLNTDAEGRLILADALHYMCTTYDPPRVVDVATLTGAMMVALGSTYTGVFTNSDAQWAALHQASTATHELLWRMPMHPEYRQAILGSRMADLANISAGRGAGASTAAMFLNEFENQDHRVESQGQPREYAHIDMAGSMDDKSDEGYHHKGMTGKYTTTILPLVIVFSQAFGLGLERDLFYSHLWVSD